MAILIRPPNRVKKKKNRNAQLVLDRLNAHLQNDSAEPVKMLCGFWKDQQNAITYQELREMVKEGNLDEQTYREWSQDYSRMMTEKMVPVWLASMEVGITAQPIMDGLNFKFNTATPGVLNWINNRGAEFVTACATEQKQAIAALLQKKVTDHYTVDELAKLIRPCIGLTEGDSKATAKLYDHIVETLTKDHPRMKQESIRKKALDKATKYAEKKHRQRAYSIAQTEMAFAYNRGADEGVRQAMSQNLLGVCAKKWSTSGDENVCAVCSALEGTIIEMDETFDFKGRVLFPGHKQLPPAHPRCGCAVEYIEVEPPEFKPDASAEPDDGGIGEHYFEGGVVSPDTYAEVAEMEGFEDTTDKRVREMVDSVNRYTGGEYTNILAAQTNFGGRFADYSGTMDSAARAAAQQDVKNINDFLSLADRHEGTVYRALGFDVGGEYDVGQYEEFKALYQKGSVVQTDTFTSWTSKKDYVKDIWAARTGVDETSEYSVEVLIRMKDSKQGVDISELAEIKGQKEVLFPKTELKINDVSEKWLNDETLRVTIEAEEVLPWWMQ